MSRGTGYLFAAWVALTVALGLFTVPLTAKALETGSLTAEISWSPNPIYVRTNVTISVQLSNPSNVSIYGISYVIYAGLGNYIGSGSISELKPNESRLLTALWTPYRPGRYQVGINASENNGTTSLVALENLPVSCFPENFFSSSGTLNCISVGLQFVYDANLGWSEWKTIPLEFIVTSTHPVVVNWSYEIYAGIGNILTNCPQINDGLPDNTGLSLGAGWRPTAPGTYKVGINITDLAGNGKIVAFWNLTVGGGNFSSQNDIIHTIWPSLINTAPKSSHMVIPWVLNNGSTPAKIRPSVSISPPGLRVTLPFGNNLSLNENQSKAGDISVFVPERIANGTYLVTITYKDENGTFLANDNVIVNIGNGTPMGRVTISFDESNLTAKRGRVVLVCATVSYSGPGDGLYDPGFADIPAGWRFTIAANQTTFLPGYYLTDNVSETRQIVILIPEDAPGGLYNITFFIRDNITEIIVAEAVIHVTIYIPPLVADLSVHATDIGLAPDPATEGTPCTLLVKVRNPGDGIGTGLVQAVDSDGTAIGSENISLEPSALINLSFFWNPSAGNHTVQVTIEVRSGGDRDVGNDIALRTFQIRPIEVPPPPPPPVPRLGILLEKKEITLEPGDMIILNLTVLCLDAAVSGIQISIRSSDNLPVYCSLLNPPAILKAGESWISQLRISAIKKSGDSSWNGILEVSVNGAGATNDSKTLNIQIIRKPAPLGRTDTVWPAIGAVATVSLVIVAAAVIGGTEVGFVAFFGLFLPLYVKIRKEEVLDQFTRGKIQGYITAYPGEHYNSIKTQLALNNGVLAYHLRVLEREGFVTSLRDGVYKRFYPKDTPLPRKRGQFSAIQDMIIENIRETPGISQDGLARKMKVSNQVIYYHIRTLMAAGAVRLEKTGKETHCYLNASGDSGSYAGVSF